MAKYKSKYYLKKEIDIIMNNLYEINRAFELFKNISSSDNHKYICKTIPFCTKVILEALFEKVLLGLAKLLCDKDNKSITVLDIIDLYNTNKEYFKEKKYYYATDINTGKKIRRKFDNKNVKNDINQLQKDINNNKYVIEYLTKRRNKSLAHNDKKYQYDRRKRYSNKKILYKDLEELISILTKDINMISMDVFGVTYAFTNNEKEEIEYLCNLIKEDKIKVNTKS